jgi:hypothetical protein
MALFKVFGFTSPIAHMLYKSIGQRGREKSSRLKLAHTSGQWLAVDHENPYWLSIDDRKPGDLWHWPRGSIAVFKIEKIWFKLVNDVRFLPKSWLSPLFPLSKIPIQFFTVPPDAAACCRALFWGPLGRRLCRGSFPDLLHLPRPAMHRMSFHEGCLVKRWQPWHQWCNHRFAACYSSTMSHMYFQFYVVSKCLYIHI